MQINQKVLNAKSQTSLILLFIIYPLGLISHVWKYAKYGDQIACILWSLFLSLVGFLIYPNQDVFVHWKYYDLFLNNSNISFFIEWKHDFLITFIQYCLAKLNIEYHYIVFICLFTGSMCHMMIYKDYIKRKANVNVNLSKLFLVFYLLFPMFGIISGLRNSLAIEFYITGSYLIFFRRRLLLGIFFYSIASITHFSLLFITSLSFAIYLLPNFKLSKKLIINLTLFFGLLFFLSMTYLFSYLGGTSFEDKVEIYGSAGDLNYIALKSTKWQFIFYFQKLLSLGYLYIFFKLYRGTKLDYICVMLIIIVIATVNYTIISNRFTLACISIISLSILNNINLASRQNLAYFNYLLCLKSLIFTLFIIQNYYKFILSPKLAYFLFTPYPVMFLDPYTNEEYATLFFKFN